MGQKRKALADAHAIDCQYFRALQKIGAKLDASRDGRISITDVREYLEDTVRADMIGAILQPLPEEG